MNKLKEINGKYYQEVEVVMLATDKATWPNCIWLGKESKILRLDTSYKSKSIPPVDNSMLPQHLYFLSNEEIKEGDWFMNRQYMIEEGKEEYAIWRCGDITPNSNPKKIIATTDTSLIENVGWKIIDKDKKDIYQSLPQPSSKFIQAFIKAYNEGKPITKVLVEMEELDSQDYHVEIDYFGRTDIELEYELKVNSSNEITIKKIKDSYTREEVEELFEKFVDAGYPVLYPWLEQNL